MNAANSPIVSALESKNICAESDIRLRLLDKRPYTSSTNIKEKLNIVK